MIVVPPLIVLLVILFHCGTYDINPLFISKCEGDEGVKGLPHIGLTLPLKLVYAHGWPLHPLPFGFMLDFLFGALE